MVMCRLHIVACLGKSRYSNLVGVGLGSYVKAVSPKCLRGLPLYRDRLNAHPWPSVTVDLPCRGADAR
ncbi:hypothetical protein TNCV_1939221 [Trichonephila clavipes]|nr:hypothetical protein TNCV_1939221 [Trichonephila clavipes]